MAVKVLARFESKITGEIFSPDKPYATEGPDATEERKAELIEKGFLAADENVAEDSEKNEEDGNESEPKHVGGGWYELPNGERVKGKDEAIAAMKE